MDPPVEVLTRPANRREVDQAEARRQKAAGQASGEIRPDVPLARLVDYLGFMHLGTLLRSADPRTPDDLRLRSGSPALGAGSVTADDGTRQDYFGNPLTDVRNIGADQGAGMGSSIALTWAHGDYFTTFGVPLIRGRNFTTEEQFENRLAVIVSKNLADRYWPGQDPIGKRLKWGRPPNQIHVLHGPEC